MRMIDAAEKALRNCFDCAHVKKLTDTQRVFFNGDKRSSLYACPYEKCPYHELDTIESKRAYYDSLRSAYTKKLLRELGTKTEDEQ